MDMMSALIGCLILILIGILLIIMVSQALIVIVQPDDVDVEAVVVSNVAALSEESNAFPHGNKEKEPWYFDVHQHKVGVYPGSWEMPTRELNTPGNKIEQKLKQIASVKEKDYVVLLIRPNGAEVARKIKKMVTERYHIDVGTELFESNITINFEESDTRKVRDEAEAGIVRDSFSGKVTMPDAAPEAPAETPAAEPAPAEAGP